MAELDYESICRKTGVSPEVEMDELDPELHLCLRKGQVGQG